MKASIVVLLKGASQYIQPTKHPLAKNDSSPPRCPASSEAAPRTTWRRAIIFGERVLGGLNILRSAFQENHDGSLHLRCDPHATRQGQEGRQPARGQARG